MQKKWDEEKRERRGRERRGRERRGRERRGRERRGREVGLEEKNSRLVAMGGMNSGRREDSEKKGVGRT